MQDKSVAGRMPVYSTGNFEYQGIPYMVKIARSVLKIVSFRLEMSAHQKEEDVLRKTRDATSAAVSTVKECMQMSRRHKKTKWKENWESRVKKSLCN